MQKTGLGLTRRVRDPQITIAQHLRPKTQTATRKISGFPQPLKKSRIHRENPPTTWVFFINEY